MKVQVLSYRVVTRMETYATERSHQHPTTNPPAVPAIRYNTPAILALKRGDASAIRSIIS
jgi:hypothetical protein